MTTQESPQSIFAHGRFRRGGFRILTTIAVLFFPAFASAENCRPMYQDTFIGLINQYRGAGLTPLVRNQTISNNVQRNAQAAFASGDATQIPYQYSGYTQNLYWGYNVNTEELVNNQWVIVNAGGNWGNVNPGGVLNKLKQGYGTLLLQPALRQVGIGCEQAEWVGPPWLQNGRQRRVHSITRAWAIGSTR